jgi:hypothetical protein
MRILSVVLLTVMTGCLNLSSLTTARSLKPGQMEGLLGGGYFSSPSLGEGADDIALPFLEMDLRYGVVENLELGGKLTIAFPFTFQGDIKYQLIGDHRSEFALALGAAAAYSTIDLDDASDATEGVTDFIFPLYISYHPAKSFAVYGGPKYVLRSFESSSMLGGNLGIQVGRTMGLRAEVSYTRELTDNLSSDIADSYDIFQVSLGGFFASD